MELRLASAGDEVKLWDCRSCSLLHCFNPHRQNVAALCWSADGSLLASCSSNDDSIVLSCAESSVSTVARLECQGGAQCLDYSSSGGMVLSGSRDGAVAIWDVKARKQRKVFKDHRRAVTCVCFNWNQSHVASGSESGDILLHNTVSSLGNSPLTLPRSPAIKALGYNHFKKSLLAACADDGQVGLWDVNARRLLHTFSEHTAPATALVFSPINELLMLTAGLDKRLICYDVQGKKALKTALAENPLTSLDIFHDGVTVAAGSTRGVIFLYDLRQGSSPVQQLPAHKSSSVQALRFQPPPARKVEGGSAKTGGPVVSAASRRQLPHVPASLPPASQPSLELSNGDASAHHSLDQMDAEEVFSPLRDGEVGDLASVNTSVPPASTPSHLSSNHEDSSSYSGVFSPLRNTSGLAAPGPVLGLSSSSLSPQAGWPLSVNNSNLDSYSREPFRPRLSPAASTTSAAHEGSSILQAAEQHHYSHGVSASPSLAEEQLSGICFSRGGDAAGRDSHLSSRSPPQTRPPPGQDESPSASSGPGLAWPARDSSLPQPAWPPQPHSPAPTQVPGSSLQTAGGDRESIPSPRPSPGKQGEQLQQLVTAAMRDVRREMREEVQAMRGEMQALLRSQNPASRGPPGQVGREDAGAGGEASAFQSQFLQNVVRDAVSEVSDRLHRDLVCLQVEMLRQFHLQEEAVREMLRQHSINEDLLAEVERLKEENRLLRKTQTR